MKTIEKDALHGIYSKWGEKLKIYRNDLNEIQEDIKEIAHEKKEAVLAKLVRLENDLEKCKEQINEFIQEVEKPVE